MTKSTKLQSMVRFILHNTSVRLNTVLEKLPLLIKHDITSVDALAGRIPDSILNVFGPSRRVWKAAFLSTRSEQPVASRPPGLIRSVDPNALVADLPRTSEGLNRRFSGLTQPIVSYGEDELLETQLRISRNTIKSAFMYMLAKYQWPQQGPATWLSVVEAAHSTKHLDSHANVNRFGKNYWVGHEHKEDVFILMRAYMDTKTKALPDGLGWNDFLPTMRVMGIDLPILYGYQTIEPTTSVDPARQHGDIHTAASGRNPRSDSVSTTQRLEMKRFYYPTSPSMLIRYTQQFPLSEDPNLGPNAELPIFSPWAARQRLLQFIELIPSTKTLTDDSRFRTRGTAEMRLSLKKIGLSRLLQALELLFDSWTQPQASDDQGVLEGSALEARALGWLKDVRPEGSKEGSDGIELRKILDLRRKEGEGIDRSTGSLGHEWLQQEGRSVTQEEPTPVATTSKIRRTFVD